MPAPILKQVVPLTVNQISQFKREGFLVLPAVLDPAFCRQARDEMWEAIQAHLPRMKRGEPSTWTPIIEEESTKLKAQKPLGGGDPYFSGNGHRFTVRNGAEELMLDLGPRALWIVAEQLLGQGTLVWPAGLDKLGDAVGPCFMCDDAVGGLVSHVGHEMGWPAKGTFSTEWELRLPKTGPVWLNGQGTRGLYCTLPKSPSSGPDYRGAHSDGACYGRWRLQMSAYIDDVPPSSGGFTVWPGSHTRIWKEQWKALQAGEKHISNKSIPIIGQITVDTQPFDCHGPAGTVVLWHTKILHIAGQNVSSNVIRQATIYGFLKTPVALPDPLVVDNTNGDIWRDWSDEVRATS